MLSSNNSCCDKNGVNFNKQEDELLHTIKLLHPISIHGKVYDKLLMPIQTRVWQIQLVCKWSPHNQNESRKNDTRPSAHIWKRTHVIFSFFWSFQYFFWAASAIFEWHIEYQARKHPLSSYKSHAFLDIARMTSIITSSGIFKTWEGYDKLTKRLSCDK